MYDDEKEQWEPKLDLDEQTKESDLMIVDEARGPSLQEVHNLQKHHEKLYRQRKDWTLFRTALGGGITLGAVCIWIIFRKNQYPEFAQWATTTLSSLGAGILGYLFGKSG